jgi:large subunit ribosomal protein L20
MARVKRGNVLRKRHKKILGLAKGFRGGSSKLFRPANQSVTHALAYAFADRRKKKGDFRQLWIARMSAALKMNGISYSVFIGKLKQQDIQINRKMFSELAISESAVFTKIVEQVIQG